MPDRPPKTLDRRGFLRALLAAPLAGLLAACGLRPNQEPTPAPAGPSAPTDPPQATPAGQVLPPTPACGDDDDPTPAQTAGPFYTPDTPQRASLLEPGLAGTRLVLTGQVLTTGCEPVAGALLDFWQADDAGQYDNAGFKLRGHQFADEAGRFSLETILPGLYPGRTRHIHVKVQAPNSPVLTTQIYFPNEPANDRDGIFRPDLVVDMRDDASGKLAAFNFVLDLG